MDLVTQVRFPPPQLNPKPFSRPLVVEGRRMTLRQYAVGVDFQKVPPGESVDIAYEHSSPGLFLHNRMESTMLSFNVEAETIELSRWILLPCGGEHRSFQLVLFPTGEPKEV